eukprot:2433353-Prymnesium_polylepis.1
MSPNRTRLSPTQEWTAAAWVAGNDGVNKTIACALLAGGGTDELAAMRSLGSRSDLKDELCTRLAAGVDSLAEVLLPELEGLASQRQATVSELQEKFSQDTKGMLAY